MCRAETFSLWHIPKRKIKSMAATKISMLLWYSNKLDNNLYNKY